MPQGTNDLTPKQAARWVKQELTKITTVEKAEARMASIENSANGFWLSPAGIKAGKMFPNSRQAQIDLYNALKQKLEETK